MSKQAAFVFICLYTLSVHQLRLVAVIIGDVGMSQDIWSQGILVCASSATQFL